jgi:hypothetical protein
MNRDLLTTATAELIGDDVTALPMDRHAHSWQGA